MLRDSVFTKEKYEQLNNLELKYETEKKEQQIESLQNINIERAKQLKLIRLVFGLSILAVIVIIFSGTVFFRNRQLRSKQKVLVTEQKLLRSQMNPHFLFNSLSAIQGYILANKSLEAGSYLSQYAKLMRSILENSVHEFITLEEELETLKTYLNLQKLRLNDKLEYTIHADKSLLEEEYKLPPMLAQPFIENAIDHGILKKENAEGRIDIHFKDNENTIAIEITDSGAGRSRTTEKKNNNHKSRAVEITNNRLALLGKQNKPEPRFEIIDLINDDNKPAGTRVIITIPKIKYSE
jgi:LytS/YehU family sensor histidine kinase